MYWPRSFLLSFFLKTILSTTCLLLPYLLYSSTFFSPSPFSLSDLLGMPASQGELGLSQLRHVCQTQMPVLSGITQQTFSLLTARHYPSPGSPYWRGSTHLVPTYWNGAPPGIISKTTVGIVSNRVRSNKLVLCNTYLPNVWGLHCSVIVN